MSPEDRNVPVYDIIDTQTCFGGALNVAHALSSLSDPSDEIHIAGLLDFDTRERLLASKVGVVRQLTLYTPVQLRKERLIDVERQCQIVRMDHCKRFSEQESHAFTENFIKHLVQAKTYDAVVISDYGKGTVTSELARALSEIQVPVFVDTKNVDLSVWKDIPNCYVKVNEHERMLAQHAECVNLIVTHGKWGSVYFPKDKSEPVYLLGACTDATGDTVGAGDAFLAGFVLGCLNHTWDRSVRSAMVYADLVAQASTHKRGTYIVKKEDLDSLRPGMGLTQRGTA